MSDLTEAERCISDRLKAHFAGRLNYRTAYEAAPPKATGSLAFHQVLDELGDMHDRKQADYGVTGDPFANVRASEDFGIPAWVGCMIRANDKMRRLMKASQDHELVNESIEDSLIDLAVYTAIAVVLYREGSTCKSATPMSDE